MDVDAMRLGQFRNQFIKGDLALAGNARLNPVTHARQLAVSAAVALSSRRQRSCFAPQPDQVVCKPRRHPKMPRCLPVPVPRIDKRHNAHVAPSDVAYPPAIPISASSAENHISKKSANPEDERPRDALERFQFP